MGQPGAKQGDRVTAIDIHLVMIPSPGGPVPTPLPHPFAGIIGGSLSPDDKLFSFFVPYGADSAQRPSSGLVRVRSAPFLPR